MTWFQREEEETKWREGKRHPLLIAHSCVRAAPTSAARSCRLVLSPTGSRATETPHRERDSPSIHRALHRDFNNYTHTLPLSARAAIMFFITTAAASTQGRWIADEIFAAMAEYKVSPSAVRIIIVTLSSPSDKLWYQGPVKSRATRGKKQPLQQQRGAP